MASISHSPLSVRSPGPNGSAQTPNNSPYGQHTASPADEGSPSIRKRFTKSLRRKLHQSPDTREENRNPRVLGRRKSIVDLFGSISKSRKQSGQDVSKNESQNATVVKKDNSVDASPPPALQRRKSLSGMFGTISQKVSPRRGSIFRRKSQNYHDDLGTASHVKDAEKNPLDSARSQVVVSNPDDPPPLPPRPSLNSGNTHISFFDQLSEVVDDIKDTHLATRQSSIGSASTLFGQAPVLCPVPAIPSQVPLSRGSNEVRTSTPDSYLQLLIESHRPEITSPSPTEDGRETPESYLQLLIESHFPEIMSPSPIEDGRDTPNSYLQLLIKSQSPKLCTPNSLDGHQRNCPSVSPSKCQPVEPVDFIDSYFNESTLSESFLLKNQIPEIKISPVSESGADSCKTIPSQEDEDREVAEEKVRLVVATMTENFHAGKDNGGSTEDMTKQEFESDQTSVWDAIKIGGGILQQPDSQNELKSFPSNEDILCDLPVHKTRKDRQVKQPEYTSLDNVIPIPLTTSGLETGATTTAVQETVMKHESIQPSFTETSPLGTIRVEYPSTIRQFANVQKYDSKEEAVAAMLDYEHCELSEYGIYDRQNRFIHARLPEAGKPDLDSMKQHGLEAFQLPTRSELVGIREWTAHTIPSINGAMNEIWESEDPPSPSKRSEDALARYLSQQIASNIIGLPTMTSSGLFQKQSQTDEVESVMNDDFFLEDQSQLAVSSEDSQSFDQSRISSLTRSLHKDDISRPPSDNEPLFWGDEEDQTPTALTWAQLGKAHQAKSPRSGSFHTLKEINAQECDDDANRSETSGRSSPYQKFFFDPSFLQCPESRVPEKIDWQSGGFCEGCQRKIHIGEKGTNVTSSRHYLTYETFYPNLHSTDLAEDGHSETGSEEDPRSYQGSSKVLFESISFTEVADTSFDPVTSGTPANSTSRTANPDSELEGERPMLPRLTSTNSREYTLNIPAAGSISWSSFLNGNVEDLSPFFGQERELVSDDYDASDTSISSRLGDSINQLPLEHGTARNGGSPSFMSELEAAEGNITHKSDPNFALLFSDLRNPDEDVPNILDTPRATEKNKSGESYPEALPERNEAVEQIWDTQKISDPIGSSSDLGLLKKAYAESWKSPLDAGVDFKPVSDSAVTRECSYGSHGAISLRDGFKFSQHDDLLLDEAGEAILEVKDQDEEVHDSSLPELVSSEMTANVFEEPLQSIRASQEFLDLEACPTAVDINMQKEHRVQKNDELVSSQIDSEPQFPVSSDDQALQMPQARKRVMDMENLQPRKRSSNVGIIELFQSCTEQKAVPPTVPNKPKLSHLISMLEARGLNTGSRTSHSLSPPNKSRIFTPTLPVTSSGMSDFETAANLLRDSVAETPEDELAGVGASASNINLFPPY